MTKTYFKLDSTQMQKLKDMVTRQKLNRSNTILDNVRITVKNGYVEADYNTSQLRIIKKLKTIEGKEGVLLIPIRTLRKIVYINKEKEYTFKLTQDAIKDELFISEDGEKEYSIVTDRVNNYRFSDDKFLDELELLDVNNKLTYDDVQNLSKAVLSTSARNSRPVLNNVLIREGKIFSTDSHRLYTNEIEVTSNEKDILIHKDLVTTVAANFRNKNKTLELKSSSVEGCEFTAIQAKDTKIIYKGTSGNFPRVDHLIPEDFNYKLIIRDAKDLEKAIKEIQKSDNNRKLGSIGVEIGYRNSELIITSPSNTSERKETVVLPNVSLEATDDLKIRFLDEYVLDALKQLEAKSKDKLQLNFVSQNRPAILHLVNNEKEKVLLMPQRIL